MKIINIFGSYKFGTSYMNDVEIILLIGAALPNKNGKIISLSRHENDRHNFKDEAITFRTQYDSKTN